MTKLICKWWRVRCLVILLLYCDDVVVCETDCSTLLEVSSDAWWCVWWVPYDEYDSQWYYWWHFLMSIDDSILIVRYYCVVLWYSTKWYCVEREAGDVGIARWWCDIIDIVWCHFIERGDVGILCCDDGDIPSEQCVGQSIVLWHYYCHRLEVMWYCDIDDDLVDDVMYSCWRDNIGIIILLLYVLLWLLM